MSDNSFKEKYIKYKRKYLILKNQKGGNIPQFIIDPNSIAYIRQNYVNLPTEVCGIFNVVNIGNNIIGLQSNPNTDQIVKGQTDGLRDWCMQPTDQPYIWHTHPAVDRGLRPDGTNRGPAGAFPSVEDILKVIKHTNEMSFIFVNQGYWVLYKSGVFPNWNDPQLRAVIEYYNNQLYNNGNRGRQLTQEQIINYIQKLNEKLGQTIGFFINFFTY